jgi:hypothetical protein
MSLIPAAVASPTTEYRQAIVELRSEKYHAAQLRLQQLILEGNIDSTVYHALGNSFYRQEKWGEAYGAYLQGLSLSPRQDDLIHNLSVIVEQLQVTPPRLPLLSFYDGCALTSFWASMMFGALLMRRWSGRRALSIVCATIMVLSLAITSDSWAQKKNGVIVHDGFVRSRIEKGVDLYSIDLGEQVTLLEKDNSHWLVEHSAFGKGWISTSMVVPLNPYEIGETK